ncbi:GIY-YIG nuclease family protein [Desulfobacula sp.]
MHALSSTATKGMKVDRKAKIREYKDTPRPMGVFQIKNKVNDKILIGSSNNLPAILNRFRSELKMGSCRNIVLQEEWKQFSPDAFEFEEIEILKPLDNPSYNPSEDLHFLEKLWTEKLKPYGNKGFIKVE